MHTQTTTLQVESWSVDRLIPYARNARTYSEIQVKQIAASITELIDAAVKRWQTYTGRFAILDQDGRSFDQVASDRLASEILLEEPFHG